MIITYELNFTNLCPNNTSVVDKYALLIESVDTIMVEDILQEVEDIKKTPLYQEDIHMRLEKKFPGAAVTLVGVHLGIKITTRTEH